MLSRDKESQELPVAWENHNMEIGVLKIQSNKPVVIQCKKNSSQMTMQNLIFGVFAEIGDRYHPFLGLRDQEVLREESLSLMKTRNLLYSSHTKSGPAEEAVAYKTEIV